MGIEIGFVLLVVFVRNVRMMTLRRLDSTNAHVTTRTRQDTSRQDQARQDLYVYLFDQVDASQQVHSKINKVPVNSFLLVLLLFQDEHVMVEELL